MITAGFDIGTRFFKICLVEDTRLIVSSMSACGRDLEESIRQTYKRMLSAKGIKPRAVSKAIATGYGANLVGLAAYELSEPACIARAVHQLDPNIATVIDVGALFNTIISIDENGFLEDSCVNEPCAAGSGKFLELVADALEIPFEQISTYASRSGQPYAITSTCAVFAESELISQVNMGIPSQDIIAGVLEALVSKVMALLGKAGGGGERIALTGGVAKIPAFCILLSKALQKDLSTLPLDPQFILSYGAALLAQGRSGRSS